MKPAIKKVAVLGANGVMGAMTGALLVQHGFDVVFFCRSVQKSEEAVARAARAARSQEIGKNITCYDFDQLERRIGDVDWVIECLSENLDIKRTAYARLEEVMHDRMIISTMTSSFPLHALVEGRTERFRNNFLAVHLFNPPNRLTLCEISAGEDTDESIVELIEEQVRTRLERVVVRVGNSAGFIANRVGFLVFSELSLLAPHMGVQQLDYLFGPYTGRALAPFATIDLIGLDIYRAIIGNLRTYTDNGGRYAYELPAYLDTMIEQGRLGAKTPETGGFYRRDEHHNRFVYDVETGDYKPYVKYEIPFIEQVKQIIRSGDYHEAYRLLLTDHGREAEVIRKVLLTYISYSFECAGFVFNSADIGGVDLAMSRGFNWLPPSAMLDLLGEKQDIIDRMRGYGIPVPDYLKEYRQEHTPEQDTELYRKHISPR